jgi:hypothetical protein
MLKGYRLHESMGIYRRLRVAVMLRSIAMPAWGCRARSCAA